MNNLILVTTEDGRSQIKLRAQEQTVWLTQLEMAELFDATKQNISLHLKNVFEDGELSEDSVVKESLTTAADGKRYQTLLYNLDAILAVGYRVHSPRGVQFRRWASTILMEYLQKGFVMDDERLKNPDGRPDHFDEMLERIRDIRASEKRFYQKVRDLFALSSDYDTTDKATQVFFATVQNLLIFAVTQKTAAELITAHANPADPHFGLLAWRGNKVRKADILIAKNYLTEDEIDTLNRLVVIFLETAELRAKSKQETRMAFWKQNVDQIITSNGFSLLNHAGSISTSKWKSAQVNFTSNTIKTGISRKRSKPTKRTKPISKRWKSNSKNGKSDEENHHHRWAERRGQNDVRAFVPTEGGAMPALYQCGLDRGRVGTVCS